MSEYDDMTNSQPYWEDLQPRLRRKCRIGDTVHPASQPEYLPCAIATQDACEAANALIATGRWRVIRCGRCDSVVEECHCDDIPEL